MASSTGIDLPEKTASVEGVAAQNPKTPTLPADTSIPGSDRYNFEQQYWPSGSKSLAGIALRSTLLGAVSALSILISIYLVAISSNPSPLWRIPFFLSILSIFHFLEFYTTAYANTPTAQVSSFLLTSNGMGYNLAHASAFSECLLVNVLFPNRHWLPSFLSNTLISIGLGMVVMGQVVRTVAMIQAGRSFNHIVQQERAKEHTLVTHGIYAYLRHPSYFGFFWWGLGTQLVLGNPLAFIGFAVVLYRFFSTRIIKEEKFLQEFFGDAYTQYRDKTPVGIPLIK